MLERVAQIFRKEFIQAFRYAPLRGLIIAPPLVNIFIFAYAFTTDVSNVKMGIQDLDNSVASRELVARYVGSGYFDVVARITDDGEARTLIDDSSVNAILRIDAGFQDALRAGRTAEVQLLLDGSDSNTASIVLNYSTAIARQFSEAELRSRYSQLLGPYQQPRVTVQSRAWFNENLESRNYYLPGVMSTTIFLATLTLTGLGIVREKELGTIEQIMVSPITPLEFLVGKTAPYGVIGLASLTVMMTLGVFLFGVPVRGNLLWIFLPAVLYLSTAVGMGLLVSTFSKTQQEAMITIFFIYFLLLFFSGFIYPIASMPAFAQWMTQINPIKHFLTIVRSVLIKGVGISAIWPQIAALALIGTVTVGLASQRFRKTYV